MSAAQADRATETTEDESFEFVQMLATELSSGKVTLSGFPDIALQVQRVLSDEDVSTARIVRVLGAEPVLAAQVLQLANSVAFNPSGKRVAELQTAVTRVGLNSIRSATLAFAVRQLQGAEALRPIQKLLSTLWQRNVLVASLCFVLARRVGGVNADTALLTGLLHGIGRLYILTRASRYRSLFVNLATYQAIERDWHLSIATAVLENWEVADEILEAVRDSEDFARQPRGAAGLGEVLAAANLIVAHQGQPELLEARLQSVKLVARLKLTRADCEAVLSESEAEIAALREALG